MGKLIIGFLVVWGVLWLLGAFLRVLGQIGNDVGQYLDRTRPARDKIGHAIGYPLGRIGATLMDYRLVDRFLLFIVVAFIAAVSVDGQWLVQALDGVGGKNFPLLGWAIFGCAAGVAMTAGSRYLELGWLGASSIARVPDIGHLRSGEAAAGRSFQVRCIAAVGGSLFLLSVMVASYLRTAEYRSQTPIEDKIAAAAAGGNVATLNGVLDDAVVRLESDPRVGLRMLLAFQSFSKDGVRPDVGRVAAAAQQYLKVYRDDTEKAVTEGTPVALARSEAFAEVDKVASLRWLGRLHEAGNGGATRDFAKAFFFFEEASITGDKTSSDMLDKLARVMVSQKDEPARQAAFRYWEPRAQSGNPQAQYWLGQWYGQSTNSVEVKKSQTWLGKVLNQDADAALRGMAFSSLVKTKDLSPGSTKLLDDLAPKYVKGSDQNLKDAAYAYLEQRANAGDPGSAMWMGFRFSEGDGVPKDDGKAREWFLKAARQDKDPSIRGRAFAALGVEPLPPKPYVAPTPTPSYTPPQVVPPPLPAQQYSPLPQSTNALPAHAQLDYTGKNWECIRGYRLNNGECAKVEMPQNAQLDYTGRSWECRRGYRLSDGECSRVEMPQNAQLDYTGRNWECRRGYRLSGGECSRVEMPQNAQLDYTGRNWECMRGYRLNGGECSRIQMPQNAQLDYTGKSWECMRGYRLNGSECFRVDMPQNATIDYTGHDWTCRTGYRRENQSCVPN